MAPFLGLNHDGRAAARESRGASANNSSAEGLYGADLVVSSPLPPS